MTWTDLKTRLDDAGYVASDELAMAINIALQLKRPILLEGDAGVGMDPQKEGVLGHAGHRGEFQNVHA